MPKMIDVVWRVPGALSGLDAFLGASTVDEIAGDRPRDWSDHSYWGRWRVRRDHFAVT